MTELQPSTNFTPVQPPEPKSSSPLLMVILVIFVVFSLAGMGFLYWQNQQMTQQLSMLANRPTAQPTTSKPTDMPTVIPTTTAISTVNWKTYTNQKYHYSINYPSDWTSREYPDTKTGASFRPNSEQNNLMTYVSIDFRNRAGDLMQLTFEDYIKNAAPQEIQNFISLVSADKIVTLSGLEGYKTIWNIQKMNQPSGNYETSLPITYFDSDDKSKGTIQVSLEKSGYINIYNQMLPTFSLE